MTTSFLRRGAATSPDILKSEGPVEPTAGTSTVDYEPFLADEKHHWTSPPDILTLTQEQEAAYQEVFNHFATEGYVVPDIKDADGKLTEEEKFYLVSTPLISLAAYWGAKQLTRVQTYECFLR